MVDYDHFSANTSLLDLVSSKEAVAPKGELPPKGGPDQMFDV